MQIYEEITNNLNKYEIYSSKYALKSTDTVKERIDMFIKQTKTYSHLWDNQQCGIWYLFSMLETYEIRILVQEFGFKVYYDAGGFRLTNSSRKQWERCCKELPLYLFKPDYFL